MAGDWEVGVSGLLLHRMLMLFEDQESSGDVLEALQAASEGCRAGLAVALAAKKTSELSGEACDFAQVEWRGGQQLMGTFKGQQRLPLVLFKSNATRLQWTSAREFLDVFDSPGHHQVNRQAIFPNCAIAELTVLDPTDTFERAMILLNAPALVVPVDFFNGLIEASHLEGGQQHPLNG